MLCRVVACANADLPRVLDAIVSAEGVVRSSTLISLAAQVPYRVLPLVRAATTLSLKACAAPHGRVGTGLDLGCWAPLRDGRYAGFDQFQVVEEARDLGVAAMPLLFVREPVVPLGCLGHLLSLDVGGDLRQREVAAGQHPRPAARGRARAGRPGHRSDARWRSA